MNNIDTLFMTKPAENHTLWGRTYYLYSSSWEYTPGTISHLCTLGGGWSLDVSSMTG